MDDADDTEGDEGVMTLSADIAPPPRHPGGRPRSIECDEKTLKRLAALGQLQCTQQEAAASLGVGLRTLKQFFAEYPESREAWQAGRDMGQVSVRRAQYKAAVKDGNVQMLIHLGKHVLGQTDKSEVTNTVVVLSAEERQKRIIELQEKALQLPAPRGEE